MLSHPLLLLCQLGPRLALQYLAPVFVQLKLRDLNLRQVKNTQHTYTLDASGGGVGYLAGVNADWDRGSIGLLSLQPVNVNHPLLSVHLNTHWPLYISNTTVNLSDTHSGDFCRGLALIVAPGHQHLVVFPHGHGADVMLGSQLLGERSAHQHPPDAGGRAEVALSLFSPRGRDALIQLHRRSYIPHSMRTTRWKRNTWRAV